MWHDDRERVVRGAAEVGRQVAQASILTGGSTVPGVHSLARAAEEFRRTFDGRFGGFGGAPKFPRPSELFFLLREFRRTGDAVLRDMVVQTLQAMAAGGMRDHVGGGFHRYSVDEQWRVPHFEKMLYDQAQLVLSYFEAAQATGDAVLLEVAEDTLRYVQRDMTDAGGGFYSAEDADSIPPGAAEGARKAEGAFYVWTSDDRFTQATEIGTVYAPDELRQLAQVARHHELKVHIDGARLPMRLHRSAARPPISPGGRGWTS